MQSKHLILALLLILLPAPGVMADDEANPVLARVNGVPITLKELEFFLSRQEKQMQPPQALAEMVSVELLVQAARNEDMLKDFSLAHEIRHNRSNLIASHYLTRFIRSVEVNDQLLRERYNEQYLQAGPSLEYNASHILVASESAAIDLIEQLKKGADFGELARAHSTGPSGPSGGALGWFKQGDMVAPFATATAQLEAGSFSTTPVKTQFGWHVILLNQTRELAPPDFASVKAELGSALVAEQISSRMRDLREQANIEFMIPKPADQE